VEWDYDRAGNLETLTDEVAVTTYQYDELNRLREKITTAPAAHTATFGYDPADNLILATDSTMGGQRVKYDYDAVNLLTSLDDPRLPDPITFAYNKSDKRIKTTYPMLTGTGTAGSPLIERTRYGDGGQLNCRYSYRANNSPHTTETDDPGCPASTATGLLTFHRYDYTKDGLDTNTRWKMTEKGNVVTDYDYDPINRLTSATTRNGGGSTVLRDFTYTYDRHSNLTREEAIDDGAMPVWNGGTLSMAYNDAEELCWSLAGTSSNGCGTTPTGATSYSYDGNGSLTGDDAATAPLELVYNVIGQTSSIDPAGTTHGPTPMSYLGVTQDNRVTKDDTDMGYGFSGLSTQNTTSGSGHQEAFVRDVNGSLLAMVETSTGGTGQVRYYLTDALNSVVATMTADAAEVRRYGYEPYGQQLRTWVDPNPTTVTTAGDPADGSYNAVTAADNAVDHSPWRFAGGYHDTETGWLKYGTRYYMPQLARWTQTDPQAGKPQQPLTQNPYLYAVDNPINHADSSGRSVDVSSVTGLFGSLDELAGRLGYVAGPIDIAYSTYAGGWEEGVATAVGWAAGTLTGLGCGLISWPSLVGPAVCASVSIAVGYGAEEAAASWLE
jgi:RHS repeat-associated protein